MSSTETDIREFFDVVRVAVDGLPRLVVYGDLDVITSARLHAAILEVAMESPGPVLVDLANVTMLDSSALGMLVVAHRRLGEGDRELRLAAVPPSVQELLQITGLAERFGVSLEGRAEE